MKHDNNELTTLCRNKLEVGESSLYVLQNWFLWFAFSDMHNSNDD